MSLAQEYGPLRQEDIHTYRSIKSDSVQVSKSKLDYTKDYTNLIDRSPPPPVWVFFDEGFAIKASKPVSVNITKGGELFIAENENLCIYASGSTLEEARHDFDALIVHFYYYYKDLPQEKVTGKARQLKDTFEQYFTEV